MAPKPQQEESAPNIVVGLDLGTTKTCALIAEVAGPGVLNVIGVGTTPSAGMRRGQVVNIDATVESIVRAVQEAERMAGVKVEHVFVGVAGEHTRGMTSSGVIA